MIYLDHAAATPVSRKVFERIKPYFTEGFFNPSAAYLPAKKISHDYEMAKAEIAHGIGAKASDLVITAGATEANNLAFTSLSSVTQKLEADDSRSASHESTVGVHNHRVLYLETEHDSVRRVAMLLKGNAIKVLPSGLVDLDDLRGKITDETELISIALVNNEIGVIQPLAEVSQMIREVRLDRMRRGIKKQLLLHSDASQALNLLDISVARIGADLLTINAAKVYGPKGVGALYVSHDVRLRPLTIGGGQENGLRSGTENVPGVIGFAEATKESKEHLNSNRKKYAKWRQLFLRNLEDYELVNKKHSLDSFIVLCYDGIDAERLVFLLEEVGIYVATGAACAASKGVRSHVLAAIGLSDSQIAGSLRITMGETNTEEQIQEAAKKINEAVRKERDRING